MIRNFLPMYSCPFTPSEFEVYIVSKQWIRKAPGFLQFFVRKDFLLYSGQTGLLFISCRSESRQTRLLRNSLDVKTPGAFLFDRVGIWFVQLFVHEAVGSFFKSQDYEYWDECFYASCHLQNKLYSKLHCI